MNQMTRTLAFAAAGIVSLGVAWLARPATIDRTAKIDDTGERFFPEFDPLEPRSMEIVGVDETSSKRQIFDVAQHNGVWSIPSHENYPADAQDKLAQAAASVMDVTKGSVVSDRSSDHALYKVVDPSAGDSPAAGSGTRVTMKDASGKTLVDLIIGTNVKDSPDLRYVRSPGRDRVYTAKVDTGSLTTKFEDWIERDLLKMQGSQIQGVVVEDYSVDETSGRLLRKGKLVFSYDPKTSTWTMDGLGPNEGLKHEKLDMMKNALADLQIVDVHRKPDALSKQLADDNGKLKLDPEILLSLQSAGYFFTNENQLVSNQGETIVKCADGVQYILRFGEVAPVEEQTDLNASSADGNANNAQLGRYVFISALFNESLLPKPEYEALPPEAASQPEAGVPATTQAAASQPENDAIHAQRDQIKAANDAKSAQFDKLVEAGKKRADDLNRRFANW
ncbi:MAG TPA: DUF4340 domain-containing protein, partial [Phycisphaerales bacterium]|nr:DUF4340 domain-containing protein [Phycisphaerales bacterium]